MFLTNEELSTIAKGDIVTTSTDERFKVTKVTKRYIRADRVSFRRADGVKLPEARENAVYIAKVERAAHA